MTVPSPINKTLTFSLVTMATRFPQRGFWFNATSLDPWSPVPGPSGPSLPWVGLLWGPQLPAPGDPGLLPGWPLSALPPSSSCLSWGRLTPPSLSSAPRLPLPLALCGWPGGSPWGGEAASAGCVTVSCSALRGQTPSRPCAVGRAPLRKPISQQQDQSGARALLRRRIPSL